MLDINQMVYYTKCKEDKMKSAIEEIFNGTFGCKDDYSSKEGSKATATLFAQEEKLMQYIKDNPEAVESFKRYIELFNESVAVDVIDLYKAAFRNGFRIAIDGLDED